MLLSLAPLHFSCPLRWVDLLKPKQIAPRLVNFLLTNNPEGAANTNSEKIALRCRTHDPLAASLGAQHRVVDLACASALCAC